MKKLVAILPLCAVAVALGLSGCSKSKTGTTASGNNGNGSDATTAPVASDQPVDMRINWTVGRKYPMRMELDQTTKTDVPNQPQPVVQEVKISQGFDLSVLKALDNGGRQLELQFESQTMDVSQGDRSVLSFNSLAEFGPGHQQSGRAGVARDDWRARSIFYRREWQGGKSGRYGRIGETLRRVWKSAGPGVGPANVR